MKRFVGVVGALFVAFLLLAPVVLAANSLPHTGRVLMSTGGDLSLPAGEHADAVIVVNGTATIAGEVNTIVVVDGAAVLSGARTETIVAVRSPVELGAETVVLGDVMTVDSTVLQTGNAQVQGQVTDLATVLVGMSVVLAPAFVLVWLGFGLATVVAGLLLAGLAARQVREAEGLISRQPVVTLGAGIVGLVVFPIVAFLLIATLIGAPLGLGILLGAWPLVAFVGYLIAGIWIGEWVLRRTSPERIRERPYLAALIGVGLLEVLALVPIVTVVVMIASLFGFGSMLVLMARKLGSPSVSQPTLAGPMSAPIGS